MTDVTKPIYWYLKECKRGLRQGEWDSPYALVDLALVYKTDVLSYKQYGFRTTDSGIDVYDAWHSLGVTLDGSYAVGDVIATTSIGLLRHINESISRYGHGGVYHLDHRCYKYEVWGDGTQCLQLRDIDDLFALVPGAQDKLGFSMVLRQGDEVIGSSLLKKDLPVRAGYLSHPTNWDNPDNILKAVESWGYTDAS